MNPAAQRAASLSPLLARDATACDPDGAFPVQSLALLRAAGLLSAPLAVALGGEGLGDAPQSLALLETLAAVGRGSLVMGRVYEGHVNALQLVAAYGTPAQRAQAARDALQGHLFGVWNTEAADGVRLCGGPDGRMALAGRKTFASGLGHVTRALVTAAVPATAPSSAAGWQMLLLATDEQPPAIDASFWKPLGMRGTVSQAADFSGHGVSAGSLIGQPGDYYREPMFNAGALRFAAVQHGGIEAIFDATRRFLVDLGRTDDPYQRARLGEMAWRVESSRLWLQGAARLLEQPCVAPAQLVGYAQLMRSAVEEQALQVMTLSNRAVGARGLLQPEPFERMHRDLTHYLRQPAPDAVLAAAGRWVLADSRPAAQLWLAA